MRLLLAWAAGTSFRGPTAYSQIAQGRPTRRRGSRGGQKGSGRRDEKFDAGRDGHHRRAHCRPEAALESNAEHSILYPRERRLIPVPLEFGSKLEYCAVIAHNLLAEFWNVYKEGCRGKNVGIRGTVVGKEVIMTDSAEDGLMHHLLSTGRSLHLVVAQRVLGEAGQVSVRLTPGIQTPGTVSFRSLGYVGSYLMELSALVELKDSTDGPSGVLRSMLCPRLDFPGEYATRPLEEAKVPINTSQRVAVTQLRNALEKIQGPPGTGKSTTIFHIINSRLPLGARVLVTCSRNVAVESIAQKLQSCSSHAMLVVGNVDRIGETAKRYLLEARCLRHPRMARMTATIASMQRQGDALHRALAQRQRSTCSRRWARVWGAYTRRKYRLQLGLARWCCRMAAIGKALLESSATQVRGTVLQETQILLCTIASTGRLMREWEDACGEELQVHTVVVDECGCTPESSVALLLRLRPRNLVLIGDHKQLPPCSLVPPQELQGTHHDRSLLERCILASGRVHRLLEQYRMHAQICRTVSDLFYNSQVHGRNDKVTGQRQRDVHGRNDKVTGQHQRDVHGRNDKVRRQRQRNLVTNQEVAAARRASEPRPMLWVPVQGTECVPPGQKSRNNMQEVVGAYTVAAALRAQHPKATIAVLTFYKGQLVELTKQIPASLGVEVLTVDSCQGAEFGYVVLSTVRCGPRGELGFVRDKQRVNVALSRAQHGLVIVGSDATLAADAAWCQVADACSRTSLMEWQSRLDALPRAQLTGVSMHEAARQLKVQRASEPPGGSAVLGGGGQRTPPPAVTNKGTSAKGGRRGGSSANRGNRGGGACRERGSHGNRAERPSWEAAPASRSEYAEHFPSLGGAPPQPPPLRYAPPPSSHSAHVPLRPPPPPPPGRPPVAFAAEPENASGDGGWDLSGLDEEGLCVMFPAHTAREVLGRFANTEDRLTRAFTVLVEMGGQDELPIDDDDFDNEGVYEGEEIWAEEEDEAWEEDWEDEEEAWEEDGEAEKEAWEEEGADEDHAWEGSLRVKGARGSGLPSSSSSSHRAGEVAAGVTTDRTDPAVEPGASTSSDWFQPFISWDTAAAPVTDAAATSTWMPPTSPAIAPPCPSTQREPCSAAPRARLDSGAEGAPATGVASTASWALAEAKRLNSGSSAFDPDVLAEVVNVLLTGESETDIIQTAAAYLGEGRSVEVFARDPRVPRGPGEAGCHVAPVQLAAMPASVSLKSLRAIVVSWDTRGLDSVRGMMGYPRAR
ncbi:hypothetical protein CYMTET_18168 [Cymbomonas tetramitiformis]|uniref:Uncharacterized protein n=1 Tax=Cymbomonas tetramitiformis TaxID=36881 RepID=A0AAE0L6F2_9CHLO|nr:hypothetical protein CYMTET_18168 [Cymbomonas tetramitiformis]